MNRFSVRVSGRTGVRRSLRQRVERILVRLWRNHSLPGKLGEPLCLVVGQRRRKTVAVWHRGLWLGRAQQTNEHNIRTELFSDTLDACVSVADVMITGGARKHGTKALGVWITFDGHFTKRVGRVSAWSFFHSLQQLVVMCVTTEWL